jgi:hypothetical protein
MEKLKYKGFTIEMRPDENADGPEQWGDSSLFLVGYNSRNFSVDAPKVYRKDAAGKAIPGSGREMFTKGELEDYFNPPLLCSACESDDVEMNERAHKGLDWYCNHCKGFPVNGVVPARPAVFESFHVFPLEAYIHSGVRLYLSGGCAVDRAWDVSQIGAVLVSRAEWPERDAAEKAAQGLIDTWNCYLSGDVWVLTVTDPEGGEVDGPCGGYYGDDYTLAEGKAIVDRILSSNTDQNGQYVFPFYNEVIKGA